MLIGLMSLPNQVVYVQFHPVAYMVKLNIEMSMASLIKKLAKDSVDDRNHRIESMNHVYTMNDHTHSSNQTAIKMKSGNHTSASVAKLGKSSTANIDDGFNGIRATTEVLVKVENAPSIGGDSASEIGVYDGFDRRHQGPTSTAQGQRASDDELPLSPQELSTKQYESHGWKGIT
jgi:hypothetical protein